MNDRDYASLEAVADDERMAVAAWARSVLLRYVKLPMTFTLNTVKRRTPRPMKFTIETVKRPMPRPTTFAIETVKRPKPRSAPKNAKRSAP